MLLYAYNIKVTSDYHIISNVNIYTILYCVTSEVIAMPIVSF